VPRDLGPRNSAALALHRDAQFLICADAGRVVFSFDA
jgi:hypothetical protein